LLAALREVFAPEFERFNELHHLLADWPVSFCLLAKRALRRRKFDNAITAKHLVLA
jgi:hypothetical protein